MAIDAGIVSAYGFAVAHGYTGTPEQFGEDQANFAANAQQVREDKEDVEDLKDEVQDLVDSLPPDYTTTVEKVDSITDVVGNMFSDSEAMGGATGITRASASEYVGTASAFQTFLLNNYTLDENAEAYVIAFDIYTEANSSSSGTGLEVQYGSRSSMSELTSFDNDQTDPYHFESFFSVTYAPTVTDRTLGLKFKANSAPNNIWHISNIRLFEGMEIPDAVTAKDTDAREKVDEAVKDLKDLKSSITENTKNLLDVSLLRTNTITVENGEVIGTAVNFMNAFSGGIPTGIVYGQSKQYVISGKAKRSGTVTSGNGLRITVNYTDETNTIAYFDNSWDDYHQFTLISSANKTIDYISFAYSSGGANVWNISEFQIEEGSKKSAYVPYITAVDYAARAEIEELPYNLEERFIPIVWEYGSIDVTNGQDSNSTLNLRSGEILHIKAGSKIEKVNNSIALVCLFYENYDLASYLSYSQIIPTSSNSYVFAEDAFVKFVLQNPQGLPHSPAWGNEVIVAKLIDADAAYKKIGLEIGILGYKPYLGNAIIIRFPNGQLMGIDTFIATAQASLIADYIRFGILHFDYFMITHYHKDHVGNVQYLIEHGFIDENTTVFLPPNLDTSYTSDIFYDWNDIDGPKALFNEVYPALVNSGCTIIHPTEGQTEYISGTTIKFWNCDQSVYYPNGSYRSYNYNDLSMGCYVDIGNFNFCDPSDLGPIGQQRMVDLNTMIKANLYTATHHGYDNGNANNYYGLLPDWINRLSPNVVFSEDYSVHDTLIMSKSSPMQSWCEATGVPNYRTSINGSMFVRLNECGWELLGGYSRFIRNDKNWSYSDNSEHIES